ncbi:CDF family cation-efflux transporter FieF [Vibrio sp. SM6]|uniref:Cation-efflux pump FieF n=1 Tax=Vibrio agarilyticus TaxID=2726741 RepID=A0A7X8YHE0_9VIBR|nr:CDF family cation-efflux transporter FieF [Vibrio agarilyticus]NLS14003.1 CDF family cation-efflux transporter FieF [Vibrio agarilyticus]
MNTEYHRLVTLAAWLTTAVAVLLLVTKISAWWLTGSVSLLASLIDSMLDIGASVLNLVVLRYALQPADREHRFGHGKAESLAALAQAMFVSGSAIFLILYGIERFFHPESVADPEYGMMVSVFAIVVTSALVLFQKQVVRKTGSQAIAADSLHYQSDVLMNIAIIIALGLSAYGFGHADAVFAIGIGLFILFSAVNMVREALKTLLDHALPEDENQRIRQITLAVPGVLGVHDLRTRLSGPTRFIQLHLELEDTLLLIEAHRIADKVEADLMAEFVGADVLIHQDPLSVVSEERQRKALQRSEFASAAE